MSNKGDRMGAGRMLHRTRHGIDKPHEDPYRQSGKHAGPIECPGCHATYKDGRWTWEAADEESSHETCPACQRIHDRFPAGYISIKGEFFTEHRDEIIKMIRAREKREKAERPLQRIMAIDDKRDGSIEITTTDSHIARSLAEALHDAYKGDLKLRYSRDENLLRASWKR